MQCVYMYVTKFLGSVERIGWFHWTIHEFKLNNTDNFKSIDRAICPYSVIATTPISVRGWFSGTYMTYQGVISSLQWKWCKTKKSKPNGHFQAIRLWRLINIIGYKMPTFYPSIHHLTRFIQYNRVKAGNTSWIGC